MIGSGTPAVATDQLKTLQRDVDQRCVTICRGLRSTWASAKEANPTNQEVAFADFVDAQLTMQFPHLSLCVFVDLRCHAVSTEHSKQGGQPHEVTTPELCCSRQLHPAGSAGRH